MNGAVPERFPVEPMPGDLEMVEAAGDGLVCFTMAGEMDVATAPRLPVRVREAMRRGNRLVCIDLSGVSFMDSTALAALLHCGRTVARGDGRMAVVHGGGEVERLLTLSRLDATLELFDAREDALRALAAGDGSPSGAGPS